MLAHNYAVYLVSPISVDYFFIIINIIILLFFLLGFYFTYVTFLMKNFGLIKLEL